MAAAKAPGSKTREMHMVHTGLRREFGLMAELVRGVAEGDQARAAIVADHVELIGSVLHHHHHAEDLAIWPRLLERCPEEVEPLIHGMEHQHERIAALGGDLMKATANWKNDASAQNRDAAVDIVGPLVAVLREHLGAEEEYVLPLIEKHITADEWDAMAAEAVTGLPQDKMPLIFGLLMYDGTPEEIEDTLVNIPEQGRAAFAEMAPKLFAQYAEGIYGTPTPPRESTLN